MNGKKAFIGTRDMQDFLKMKFAMGSSNNFVTNMTHPHSCTTRSVELVLAAVCRSRGLLRELGGVEGSESHFLVGLAICNLRDPHTPCPLPHAMVPPLWRL